MSEDAVVERLKEGEITDEDVALLTDDDVRQLVIYYATIARNPALRSNQALDNEVRDKLREAWRSLPRLLWNRVVNMVLSEGGDRFWDRPADLNNRFGIG